MRNQLMIVTTGTGHDMAAYGPFTDPNSARELARIVDGVATDVRVLRLRSPEAMLIALARHATAPGVTRA